MNLQNEIIKLTCELYKDVKLSRSTVQNIIVSFKSFIGESYNPSLLKLLKENIFNAVSEEAMDSIYNTFKESENPFENVDTEKKRFLLYIQLGLYIEPETCILEEECVSKVSGGKVSEKTKTSSMVHLSLRHSLKKLFEIENLLVSTLEYIDVLNAQETLMTNFIQGSLWKNISKNVKKDGIILPLLVYFDDVETGNPLGAHAGINKVGTVYANIPCLPPSFASKLDSIIVTDLFYSSDRKRYGNKVIFKKLVDELKHLEDNALEIYRNEKIYKIYFITTLVLGDNLGLNSILGFTESFSSTYFCRICYAGSLETKHLTIENEDILRTKEKYMQDIHKINTAKTGIKETCIFNELSNFNVIENATVDAMHDVMEGVANDVMTKIILKLVDQFFSIDVLNDSLKVIDFAFETTNIPPPINLNYVKTHGRLKMSASETLFFARYFGIMVGEYVPVNNEVWSLYIKLREIINIITSPEILPCYLQQLEVLIDEHHSLYMKLFGDLKPKFHLLLHYVRMIKQNGPIISISSLRFESKHREIRSILQSSSSKKQALKTVGIRIQLSIMNFKYSKYKNLYVSYGPEIKSDALNIYFPSAQMGRVLSSISINDINYKSGTIIVAEICENGLRFGKIDAIIIADNKIYFNYIPFKLIGFNEHYFAFSVSLDNTKKIIDYETLASRIPCLLCEKNKITYVATRYIL